MATYLELTETSWHGSNRTWCKWGVGDARQCSTGCEILSVHSRNPWSHTTTPGYTSCLYLQVTIWLTRNIRGSDDWEGSSDKQWYSVDSRLPYDFPIASLWICGIFMSEPLLWSERGLNMLRSAGLAYIHCTWMNWAPRLVFVYIVSELFSTDFNSL